MPATPRKRRRIRWSAWSTALVLWTSALPSAAAAAIPEPGSPLPLTPEALRAHNQERLTLNTRAMSVLGAWSVLNLAVGGVGAFTAKDPRWRSVHEMNAAPARMRLPPGPPAPSSSMAMSPRPSPTR